MNKSLRAEVLRLGGDPTDLMWRWFLLNGPHGASFSWAQTRAEAPGYVGLDHLRKNLAEYGANDPTFTSRIRDVINLSLQSNDPNFLRRAIQILAVIGSESDLQSVAAFQDHANSFVAGDARACMFVLRRC